MKKRHLMKKVVSVLLGLIIMASLLSGCGINNSDSNNPSKEASKDTSKGAEEKESEGNKYKDFLTVDVFDEQANFQGIQVGWFAKIVKEKFNMELNIIAPNVAGGGDTLYQTRSANGNLGDLILTNADQGRLSDLVKAGLVMDMTPYVKNNKNLTNRKVAIDFTSSLAKQDGMWAIPSNISILSPLEPTEPTDPTCAPSIRWDLYKKLGYPTINTLEDLLPIMKNMQDIAGKSKTGKKVYAFSLFKDWDGDLMQNAGSFTAFYGYNTQGFALYNPTNQDVQSIIDSNSQYVRGLRFLYKANQMGLVDPESTTQSYDTLGAKYKDNAVLFAFWPWLGAINNTTKNTKAGIGFATATINDGRYLAYGGNTLGTNIFTIMVGSKAKDPQRLVDFINWLYSPEGISVVNTGPKGLSWDIKDGKPFLTNFGEKYYIDGEKDLMCPAEYGGSTFDSGISALNFKPVGGTEINPETGTYYNCERWDSFISKTSTPITQDWSNQHEGYVTPIQYFKDKGFLSIVPGVPFATKEYTTDVETIKEQCKQIILQDSWQMCFAKDDKEFNDLLKDMQNTVVGLGYDQVFEADKKNCETLFESVNKYIKTN